MQKFFAYLIKI